MIVTSSRQSLVARCLLMATSLHLRNRTTKRANGEFARCSRKNLRENCSGPAAENVAVGFLQTFPRARASLIERKNHFRTATYAWRSEMSGEFRENREKLAIGERRAFWRTSHVSLSYGTPLCV